MICLPQNLSYSFRKLGIQSTSCMDHFYYTVMQGFFISSAWTPLVLREAQFEKTCFNLVIFFMFVLSLSLSLRLFLLKRVSSASKTLFLHSTQHKHLCCNASQMIDPPQKSPDSTAGMHWVTGVASFRFKSSQVREDEGRTDVWLLKLFPTLGAV